MRYRPSITIFVLLLLACNNNEKKSDGKEKNSLHENLIGTWGGFTVKTPVFDITRDSIFMYGHGASYAYTVEGKDLVLADRDMKIRLRNVEVFGDTLILESPKGSGMVALRYKTVYPH